jgi:hypothetical protein
MRAPLAAQQIAEVLAEHQGPGPVIRDDSRQGRPAKNVPPTPRDLRRPSAGPAGWASIAACRARLQGAQS